MDELVVLIKDRVFDRFEELCKVSMKEKKRLRSISRKPWRYGIEKGIDI